MVHTFTARIWCNLHRDIASGRVAFAVVCTDCVAVWTSRHFTCNAWNTDTNNAWM